jgi:hypothetical protein
MKKIYVSKPKTPVAPEHGPIRRFINQMFANILKRQTPDQPDDFMQRLEKIEYKIKMMEREKTQKPKRSRSL